MCINLRDGLVKSSLSIIVLSGFLSPCQSQTLEWARQLGTSADDYSQGVSLDGLGNAYLAGNTEGSLEGANAGGSDAFLTKYDAGGNLQWTRQLGTSSFDGSADVSVDSMGNAYLAGSTMGSFEGMNAGGQDAFITKHDEGGNLQWTRQLGTNANDGSSGVSTDGLGNVYLTGVTNGILGIAGAGERDVFLVKYDAAGNLHWTQQFGTNANDYSHGVSADGLGNVYLAGYTLGSLGGASAGGYDAFVTQFNAAGVLQWTRQFGTASDDVAYGVSADGMGNVYLSGYTTGSLGGTNAGDADVFIAKYDIAGSLEWTRQLGTSKADVSLGVSTDGLGNVYISGTTPGSLGGMNAGNVDTFMAKYDGAGNLQWTQQFGSIAFEHNSGLSTDGLGNVYLLGDTTGSLSGTNVGGRDVFVAKFSDRVVPEPTTLLLLILGGSLEIVRRRRTL